MTSDQSIDTFIVTLAKIRARCIKFAASLRSLSNVVRTTIGLDLDDYDASREANLAATRLDAKHFVGGQSVWFYVEADLRSGQNVCWWLQVFSENGTWRVERSVYVSDSDSDTGRNYPEISATSFSDLAPGLLDAVESLLRVDASPIDLYESEAGPCGDAS